MRGLACLLCAAALSACAGPSADAVARSAAKSAVNPVLASRFPGIPLEPATDCIIDNATAAEIITFARAAGGGASEATARLVLDVASRPDTIACLATDGLPVLLQTL